MAGGFQLLLCLATTKEPLFIIYPVLRDFHLKDFNN